MQMVASAEALKIWISDLEVTAAEVPDDSEWPLSCPHCVGWLTSTFYVDYVYVWKPKETIAQEVKSHVDLKLSRITIDGGLA